MSTRKNYSKVKFVKVKVSAELQVINMEMMLGFSKEMPLERAIFFESYEGRLHRCKYAGLDNNSRPQWVMVDQGDELMTLQDYMEMNAMKDEEMRLLCLEGEALESTTMAVLLGAVLQGYPLDYARDLTRTIMNLRRRGIGWKQEKLELGVHVFEYYEEVNHKNAYRFSISCYGFGFIMEMDNFYKMKDLMDVVRGYFEALETEAGIGLKKELWSHDKKLLIELDDEDKKMFDIID